MTLYLSRARLRADRGEAFASIAPILLPDDDGQRTGRAHRLVWLLFQDQPDATRDFLWRDDGNGHFMVLSRREPANVGDLFDLETKAFEPALAAGDQLRFALHANPTIASTSALTADQKAKRQRGKRVDVVMDALSKLRPAERAAQRDTCVAAAGRAWIDRQGERNGFTVVSAEINGYDQKNVADPDRRGRRDRAIISTLDIAGVLTVIDPVPLLAKLAAGFGSAKAFGCGLMLIRRA